MVSALFNFHQSISWVGDTSLFLRGNVTWWFSQVAVLFAVRRSLCIYLQGTIYSHPSSLSLAVTDGAQVYFMQSLATFLPTHRFVRSIINPHQLSSSPPTRICVICKCRNVALLLLTKILHIDYVNCALHKDAGASGGWGPACTLFLTVWYQAVSAWRKVLHYLNCMKILVHH